MLLHLSVCYLASSRVHGANAVIPISFQQGLGKITDPDCLQQATADQAFTNAKKAGDVNGQVGALIYRALERNTGKVGLASVACTSIKAVNPEIAAISQHQVSLHSEPNYLTLIVHVNRRILPPAVLPPSTKRLHSSWQSKLRV
jgi:hypothetical protein